MCGISALFSTKRIEKEWIEAMTAPIRHRGPDDEGYALFDREGKVHLAGGGDTPADVWESSLPWVPKQTPLPLHPIAALGHRRLSILDLSAAGHQPMCDPEKRLWITYNGEVYNYIEIRNELLALGHTFITGCDTEVIVHAYREWGVNCLSRFNGMFAFVIFDTKTQEVFAARDRFGVKPLYTWISPTGLIAFASEIKQFTVLPGWKATLSSQNGYDFLLWGISDHREETSFENVRQISGGSYLFSPLDTLLTATPTPWYSLPTAPSSLTFQEATIRFTELFEDSVRLRLRADVPVGSCLSGGLDSSSIVCVMRNLLDKQKITGQQLTFSALAAYKPFDESHYMREVIAKTGVASHTTTPDLQALFTALPAITWHQDEPFGSTSIFAQWEVFKLARHHNVKVMLDGQGADEQLAGYTLFFRTYLLDLWQSRQFKTLWNEIRLQKELQGIRNPLLSLLAMLVPESGKQLARRLVKGPHATPDWLSLDVAHPNPHPPSRTLNHLTHAQLTRTNLPMLLRYEDRDSMAHSIESRTPFIDYRLVELVQSLPASYKLSGATTKRILRESTRGILPESIRTRRDKLGFATPEEVWVTELNPCYFKHLVRAAVDKSCGVIRPSAIPIADAIIDKKRPFDFFVWRLIQFGEWMERFSVKRK